MVGVRNYECKSGETWRSSKRTITIVKSDLDNLSSGQACPYTVDRRIDCQKGKDGRKNFHFVAEILVEHVRLKDLDSFFVF